MNKQATINDISAPQAISPPSPGNPMTLLVGYIPQTAVTEDTEGTLTFNDCATLAEASIENQIYSTPGNNAWGNIGQNSLNIPIATGLVVSSIPTGMTLSVVYAFYVAGNG
jgi:hypothetical protein